MCVIPPRTYFVESVADWLAFRGRPSGRTVCSNPRSLTVCRTHSSPPWGRPLSMLTRTWSSSFAVKGALTRAVQFARQDTNGLPLVRLDLDALERFTIGLLAEHLHPAD